MVAKQFPREKNTMYSKVRQKRSLQFWVENKYERGNIALENVKKTSVVALIVIGWAKSVHICSRKRIRKKIILQNGGKYPYTFFSRGENVS